MIFFPALKGFGSKFTQDYEYNKSRRKLEGKTAEKVRTHIPRDSCIMLIIQ